MSDYDPGFHACEICFLSPEYKCLTCSKYFCYFCGPDQHKTHRAVKEMISPSPDRFDFSGFSECQNCMANVPRCLKKCFCCHSDNLKPLLLPEAQPLQNMEVVEFHQTLEHLRLQRAKILQELPWICEWCNTVNSYEANQCIACDKNENELNLDPMLTKFRDKLKSLANSALPKRIKVLIHAQVDFPIDVAFRLDPHFFPNNKKAFQADLLSAYQMWDQRGVYTLKEFTHALHCTSDMTPAFTCKLQRRRIRSNLSLLVSDFLSTEEAIKRIDRGCFRLDMVYEFGNENILKEIGALEDSCPTLQVFSDSLSGENFQTCVNVILGELGDQPHLDSLIALVHDWDNLNEVTLGEMRIALDKSNGNFPMSYAMLKQECQSCKHPIVEFKLMKSTFCSCWVCLECFAQHLMRKVTLWPVSEWNCSACGFPQNHSDNKTALTHLLALWKDFLHRPDAATYGISPSIIANFQDKLLEHELRKHKGVVCCVQCKHIWIENGRLRKCQCPNCNEWMCRACLDVWTTSHDTISCENMLRQKIDDPDCDIITCPECGTMKVKVLGKCEHFDCSRCGTSFCSCGALFFQSGQCKTFPTCDALGFHGHHPRNCFTYLRNTEDIQELEMLIKMHQLKYERPQCSENCCMPIGMDDSPCNKPVYMYDLCLYHMKFHLSKIIQLHDLDPVDVMSTPEMIILLKSVQFDIPLQHIKENDSKYRSRLVNIVKEKWPLHSSLPLE